MSFVTVLVASNLFDQDLGDWLSNAALLFFPLNKVSKQVSKNLSSIAFIYIFLTVKSGSLIIDAATLAYAAFINSEAMDFSFALETTKPFLFNSAINAFVLVSMNQV